LSKALRVSATLRVWRQTSATADAISQTYGEKMGWRSGLAGYVFAHHGFSITGITAVVKS
jgi:hypothetical protein